MLYTYYDEDGGTITTSEPLPPCRDWMLENERFEQEINERFDHWESRNPDASEEQRYAALDTIYADVEKLFN